MDLKGQNVLRALWASVVLILLVSLIGVATVDDDDDGSANLDASDRTTTTASTTSTTASVSTTAGSTETTEQSTATTKGLSSTTIPGSGAIPDPGATKAPKPGSYTFKYTNSSDQSRNGEITEKIEVLPNEGSTERRRDTYPDGQGNTFSNDVSFGADAVKVTASHITSEQATVDCTWNPPIIAFALPLTLGKQWSFDSTCTATLNGVQVTIRRKADNKVVGKATDQIGSTSARAWVIEGREQTTVTSPFFNQVFDTTFTRHWAADYGLIIWERDSGTANGQAYTAERALQNLNPK